MFSAYWSAWIATFASGLVAVIQKLTTKYSIKNQWLFIFVFSLFTLIFTVPLALMNHVSVPSQWNNIFLAAFFSNLFWIFFIWAMYKLDVTVLSPLFNFRGVFGVILGLVFLGEVLQLTKLIFICVIIIAGIFVSIDEKFHISSFFKPAIGIALLAMFCLALNGYFINQAATQNTFWQLTLWQGIFAQLLFLLTIPLFIRDLKSLRAGQIGAMIMIALISVIYNLAANKAFSSNVSVTSVIVSFPASMIIAFVFSLFAPKLLEKHTLKVYLVRFIATAVMIFAALRLS